MNSDFVARALNTTRLVERRNGFVSHKGPP